MKIGIHCYLTADILTKVLQKCVFSGPIQNIPFCCYHLISLVTMATKRQTLQKKINSSEAVWGIKLKPCRIVSNNSLCKKESFIFIAVAQALWLLWQIKVSIDLQWEK